MNISRSILLVAPLLAALSSSSVQANPAETEPHKKIAILLFDGADIIDFAAPYDVFLNARMDVFTVSRTGAPIATEGGMKVTPTYSFSDLPDVDAVLIPGGDVHNVEQDPATLAWIKLESTRGAYLLSVCNGAFTLANTGLLTGLRATTTSGNIDALRRRHADVEVVRDARVVDNGRIITTGGLSAGIDGALHLVARLSGQGEAQRAAEVMEYNWLPEGSFLPATHAFHVMHQTLGDENLIGAGHIEALASTAGDDKHWSYAWRVRSDLADAELANRVDVALAEERREMRMNPPYAASKDHQWTFIDADGQLWHERLDVESIAGQAAQHLVTLSVAKDEGPPTNK